MRLIILNLPSRQRRLFARRPAFLPLPDTIAQRLRLDRDREASRDLNRLLNKPGSVSLETAFCGQPGKRAGGPAVLPDGAGFGA